ECDVRIMAERFSLAIQAAANVIFDWDLESNVLWRTSARTGFLRESAVKTATSTVQWWVDHIHDDDRARVMTSLQSALSSNAHSWSESYRLVSSRGRVVSVYDRATIKRDANGRALRLVGIGADVSETNRMRAE